MLTDAELIERIKGGETDCVEFAESVRDLDKIREAICTFANDLPNHKAPGLIFIGIRDDGSVADLSINDTLLTDLGGLRDDGKILPFPNMQVDKRKLLGGEIAVIEVTPSDNPPVKFDNRCWIRVGSRHAQASAEEERRLMEKRRWGQLSYDMQGVEGASIEDHLDRERFMREYSPCAISPEVLEENNRSSNEQMLSLRLIRKNIPTVTAILILGNEPRDWFPGAYIQFVRFEGNENMDPIKSQREIDGTLPDQLRELDNILKVNISVALDPGGETHVELSDYPYAALRELVRNAVIHRNYERSNTPVRIYWFSDKVTISSPGGVYGEVSNENFGKGATSYRNPTIAEAMKNMGFMQRFGIGLPTVNKALKNNGNPQVEFEILDSFVNATVRKRP